jgi:alkyl sulfatase BDS1-like metallo-beta-lactamase superfamily hydrolase
VKPILLLNEGTGNGRPPWAPTTIVVDDTRPRTPSIIEITDGVYCAHGYAFANVFFVETGNGLVVIDTSESIPAARAVLDDFRKISELPIRYLIYTHYHGDHTRAGSVFREPDTKIIAQQLLLQEIARKNWFLPYRRRVNLQHYAATPELIGRAANQRSLRPQEIDPGYLPPDITFDDAYFFEEDGVEFELYHTVGETLDHLMVWLPQKKVLFPADLVYAYFPMLSSPMKPDRPVLKWAESVERMCALRPEFLAPSHGPPMAGAEKIERMLTNHARAIRHVHDETVKCINAGKSVEEAIHEVKLPEDLARYPYLRPKYGKVSWTVRGIFRQYTGWYSFNPTDLNPRPEPQRHRVLLRACGGPSPLLQRAARAMREEQYQLALELVDVVLSVLPHQARAVRLKLMALRHLAAQSRNGVERNIYRNALKSARSENGRAKS